ncbi:DUF882 domain-containing protein [Roseibium sp.]|uniref:DUF882 domain-containing protein n=1 Tax=Roseibium sp. TaxID=1936156 RepID=UPI003A977DAF
MILLALCAWAVWFPASAQAETRTLSLYNTHTHERVKITFKKNGRYLQDGLREANRFLRDWRRNEITKIDPKLLDLVWEVYQEIGASKPIYVVSSYRSPATNNMLRKRSSGVAQNSQHTRGRAMDFYIPGVNLATLRATGLRKQVGGVGYYPTSGSPFVHMDTGSVRHWPRMTRSQLAKVFPDGNTIHVPTDGKPLSGYKVALAKEKAGTLEKLNQGGSRTTNQVASAAPSRSGSSRDPSALVRAPISNEKPAGGNFIASLFGNGGSAESARVAATRSESKPLPPGKIGTSSAPSTPAPATIAALSAPPIPLLKTEVAPAVVEAPAAEAVQDTPETPEALPFAIASSIPFAKPSRAAPAPEPDAPRNTLDGQRQAIERGDAPSVVATIAVEEPAAPADLQRFAMAGILPTQKPTATLVKATEQAAKSHQELALRMPEPAPALKDGAAAIAAATGTAPRIRPNAPASTLAYAPAAADLTNRAPSQIPGQAARQLADSAQQQRDRNASDGRTEALAYLMPAIVADAPRQSVSGTIPRDEIIDPLAGFASLPDKSDPTLLSAKPTKRNAQVAALHHPHQRQLQRLMQPGNRFLAQGFSVFPYGAMRSERFDGPAIIVLPVRYAR